MLNLRPNMLGSKIKPAFILVVVMLLCIIATAFVWRQDHEETTFLLASEGAAATTWLTDVLNSTKLIHCTHYDFVDRATSVQAPHSPSALSLQSYFALLKKYNKNNRRIYGNVHGYVLGTILQKKPSTSIRVANLIRHPITQINSMHKYWLRKPEQQKIVADFMHQKTQPSVHFPASNDQYTPAYNEALAYAALLRAQGIEFPDDLNSWTFLIILGRYDRVHSEMLQAELYNIPQFKFEEYTTQIQALDGLIRYISNNKLQLDNDALTALIQKPATNVNHTIAQEPAQIYASWAPWQKQAFALHLQNIGGKINNAYVHQGYDLSFVAL